MKKVLKGNHAVSHAVKLSRAQVISAYPITPQTTIVEELSEMCATGELDARFIKVESEHSALAALVGAATAGVRTFTATSGNGLLYMHEVLHWAAGSRLPIVMANVNRAVTGGWNIWADQTDSLAQRDTGWIQLYCESNQEVLDSVIMAFKLAEKALLPVMIAYDAFFLSHTSEVVDVPDQEAVDGFLPRYAPPVALDFDQPRMFNGMIPTDLFMEQRYRMHHDHLAALDGFQEICRDFEAAFGRAYGAVEVYGPPDPETIIVTAGTTTSVARLAVDELRNRGRRVGLMKLRLFRPVPAWTWREVLGRAARVIVIDRNLSVGAGGVLANEIQAALYPLGAGPLVFPVVAGLGGRDVTPDDIVAIIERASAAREAFSSPLFWGLKE
ncbi:MAG: transketolase C-terminal domain-containing protein [Thermodesulfobacteriota bacterium]